ncbi:MAG: hypothetical protein ACFFD9_01175 [Candidatus Thorarchaeota archaeon]
MTSTGHAIEAILITDKTGSTRFYMQLDPRAFGMDPAQASIFFAALDMFSDEVFEESEPVFHLDYGPRVFTVLKGVETNLIAVGAKRLNQDVMDVLDSLLAEFELEWLPAAKSIEAGSSFEDIYFESFGESVMKNLSLEDLPDSWIPYFTINPETMSTTSGPIIPFIDGSRSVKEIREVSGITQNEMLMEASRLWAHRVIRFRNMLSFDDFVGAKTPFLRYIQADSQETEELRSLHPEMAEVLPRLAGLMDGRRTIRETVAELGESYDERQVLRVLDHLLENDVIEALSSEKRRILLVKEALEISLRVAEDINRAQSVQAMRSVVNRSVTPETLGQLRFVDNRWSVDFDFKLLEGLSHRRLMLLYGEWMKILAQFVAVLDRENLYVFIAIITEEFHERIVNRYAPRDLRGLEEFSFWLEQLSTEILSQPRAIRTGSLEPTGEDGPEELAYILVTRGQVIHGQERISRICTTAGVPLTDVPPDFWTGWQKAESIEKLLSEYAKLGYAARLTLLILSRQLGVSLPKEAY